VNILMLSLGSARAALLLYQNAHAVKGLSRYLVSFLRESNDGPLARQLDMLCARADSVCPALDFLSEWCSDKGSAVQTVLFHARDTLQRIERFLASIGTGVGATSSASTSGPVKGRGGINALTEGEKDRIIEQINGLVRELDFSLNSLSLAISVVNAASAARPVLPAGATYAASPNPSAIPSADLPRYISPSCLLRASERMRSMAGGSGDLAVVYGSFWKQTSTPHTSVYSYADAIRNANSHGDKVRWDTPMCPVADIHSSSKSESASISDEFESEQQYGHMRVSESGSEPQVRWLEGGAGPEMRLDSHATHSVHEWSAVVRERPRENAPLAATQSTIAAAAAPTRSASCSPNPDSIIPGLSPWRRLFSSACLKLVRSSARSMYELHVSDLSLSPRDQLSRPSSSTLKFALSASLAFRTSSSVLLSLPEEAVMSSTGVAADIGAVFAFEDRIANTLQARYAFVLHSNSADSGSDVTGVAVGSTVSDSISPLEVAYLSRLCTYENMHTEHSRSHGVSVPPLAHTKANDEELWLLLAGVHIHTQTPPTPLAYTHSSAGVTQSTESTGATVAAAHR
jgi:hypothetical protein